MQRHLEAPIRLMPEERQLLKASSLTVEVLHLPEGSETFDLPSETVMVWDKVHQKMQVGLPTESAEPMADWEVGFWGEDDEENKPILARTPTGVWFVIGNITIKQDEKTVYTARRLPADKAHRFLSLLGQDSGPLSREERLAEAVLEAHFKRRTVKGLNKWVEHKQKMWSQAATWVASCFGKTDHEVENLMDRIYESRENLREKGFIYAHCTWAIKTLAGIIGVDPSDWED